MNEADRWADAIENGLKNRMGRCAVMGEDGKARPFNDEERKALVATNASSTPTLCQRRMIVTASGRMFPASSSLSCLKGKKNHTRYWHDHESAK